MFFQIPSDFSQNPVRFSAYLDGSVNHHEFCRRRFRLRRNKVTVASGRRFRRDESRGRRCQKEQYKRDQLIHGRLSLFLSCCSLQILLSYYYLMLIRSLRVHALLCAVSICSRRQTDCWQQV